MTPNHIKANRHRDEADMAIVSEGRFYQRRIRAAVRAGSISAPHLNQLGRYLRYYRAGGFPADLAWHLGEFRLAMESALRSPTRARGGN